MVNLKEKAKKLMYGYFDALGLDGGDLAMAVESSEIKMLRGKVVEVCMHSVLCDNDAKPFYLEHDDMGWCFLEYPRCSSYNGTKSFSAEFADDGTAQSIFNETVDAYKFFVGGGLANLKDF